jgi:hypothetical protein
MSKDNLEAMTKEELCVLAKKLDVPISRKLPKPEMIALLTKAMTQKKSGTTAVTKAVTKPRRSTTPKPTQRKTSQPSRAPARKNLVSQRKRAPRPEPGFTGPVGDRAQEAKFVIGHPHVRDETGVEQDLPLNYGYNKLVLMVRDPYWAYAYWEIQQDRIDEAVKALGKQAGQTRWLLRVFTLSDARTAQSPPTDIEIQSQALNWYLQLHPAGASFYAEIGLMNRQNRFYRLASSNTITLPPDRPSDVIDDQWLVSDEVFHKLYTFSSGSRMGGGSEAVRKGEGLPFAESSWGMSRFFGSSHATGKGK